MTLGTRWAFAVSAALGALACSNTDAPDPTSGGIVRGHVSYAGADHTHIARPALQVAAFTTFPPSGAPHALDQIEHLDFSAPVAFELRGLPMFPLKITAQIVDLDKPVLGPSPYASGGYPNMCKLMSPAADVTPLADGTVENIDFSLYDGGGSQDPCGQAPAAVCPMGPGVATARFQVASTRAKADADQINVAFFANFPGAPSRFKATPGSSFAAFPVEIIDNAVPVGGYVVSLCYDVGGDNLIGCAGPGDLSLYAMNKAKVAFDEGKVITFAVDLDTMTIGDAKVEEKAAHGCM